MKFNSPLLRLSSMMLNNGELKSALSIPHVWRIENFRCNIGMSILHQGVKEIGQIRAIELYNCGHTNTWYHSLGTLDSDFGLVIRISM